MKKSLLRGFLSCLPIDCYKFSRDCYQFFPRFLCVFPEIVGENLGKKQLKSREKIIAISGKQYTIHARAGHKSSLKPVENRFVCKELLYF